MKSMLRDAIRLAMSQHETSVYALANATGIPKSTLYGFINDNADMGSSTVDTLLAYFGLCVVPTQRLTISPLDLNEIRQEGWPGV